MNEEIIQNTKKKIVIVDDHPIIRQGLQQLCEKQHDLMICGEVEGAQQALQSIEKTHPDLVIVDISLKQGNGLELIKNIKALYPKVLILVLSMHDESIYAERSIQAGAKGYIMKSKATDELLKAIRSVMAGKIYLSEGVNNKILENVFYHKKVYGSPIQGLSDRELQVFQLIAEGYKRNTIAHQLNTSVNTIDTHFAHIKKKLGLKSSNELINYAVNYYINHASSP